MLNRVYAQEGECLRGCMLNRVYAQEGVCSIGCMHGHPQVHLSFHKHHSLKVASYICEGA